MNTIHTIYMRLWKYFLFLFILVACGRTGFEDNKSSFTVPMSPKWSLGCIQNELKYENERQLDSLTWSGSSGNRRSDTMILPEDIPGTWNSFKLKIYELTDTSVSGISYSLSEEREFTDTNEAGEGLITPELFTRWFEFKVFSPQLQLCGGEKELHEKLTFDEITGIITSSYLKLRYRLIPYLYSYMYRASTTGEPLIKPLFFLFDDPKAAQYQGIEYIFGNEFLVAPVTEEGQIRKTVYLPQLEGGYKWIDYWTDEPLSGGNDYSFKVPIQEIPLFIKQPAIIPLAKLKNWLDESPDDTLTVDIYPGGYAEFILYEDNGITNDYLTGEYAITNLETDKSGRDVLVKIPAVVGNYTGMVGERTWFLAIHLVKGFDEILVNGMKISPVEYVRALTRNTYYYDLNSYMLVLDVGGDIGESILVRIKKCKLIE
jgi:alpha-glucosidase (family GH31 glycosyl hydrolase)